MRTRRRRLQAEEADRFAELRGALIVFEQNIEDWPGLAVSVAAESAQSIAMTIPAVVFAPIPSQPQLQVVIRLPRSSEVFVPQMTADELIDFGLPRSSEEPSAEDAQPTQSGNSSAVSAAPTSQRARRGLRNRKLYI